MSNHHEKHKVETSPTVNITFAAFSIFIGLLMFFQVI